MRSHKGKARRPTGRDRASADALLRRGFAPGPARRAADSSAEFLGRATGQGCDASRNDRPHVLSMTCQIQRRLACVPRLHTSDNRDQWSTATHRPILQSRGRRLARAVQPEATTGLESAPPAHRRYRSSRWWAGHQSQWRALCRYRADWALRVQQSGSRNQTRGAHSSRWLVPSCRRASMANHKRQSQRPSCDEVATPH